MSVASALEASIVIESELGAEGGRELDACSRPQGSRSSRSPSSSWRPRVTRFATSAKGVISYALSRTTGEALLFKGGDFGRTDVAQVARI